MKIQLIFTAFILLLLLFSLSCSESEKTYTVETVDGVRHVHNRAPLWGNAPKVKLEFVQKIGELESEDENYIFYRPSDIVTDEAGNMYVLDAGNRRVQKFNARGDYVQTIGRPGGGPGEFGRYIRAIDYLPPNSVLVSDESLMKIHRFSLDGNFLQTYSMNDRFRVFRVLGPKDIVCPNQILLSLNPKNERQPLFHIRILDTGDRFDVGSAATAKNVMATGVLNEITFDTAESRNILCAYRYLNRIEAYDSRGGILFSADRHLDYDVNESPAGQLDAVRISEEIGVDSRNRIWVRSIRKEITPDLYEIPDYDYSVHYHYQIFDETGVHLGNLPVPRTGNIRICKDRLFIIVPMTDMAIYEYRIVDLEEK